MNKSNLIVENTENGIGKMDEQRALQYIRYRLIPLFVDKVYNSFLRINPHANDESFPRGIGYQTFRNALIKKRETVNMIVYSCDITRRLYVDFSIIKHNGKKLRVGLHHQLMIIDKNNDKWFDVNSDEPTPIREPLGLKESVEVRPVNRRLSKTEELRALQYIRQTLLPFSVKEWNVRAPALHQLKGIDVSSRLQKRIHNIYPDNDKNHDYIVYSSRIPVKDLKFDNEIKFDFTIRKNDSGIVRVKFYTPFISGGGFDIGDHPDSESTSPGLYEDNRETIPHKYNISKAEEYYAVEFLKRVEIPEFMEFSNETKHYTGQPPLNTDTVRRTLKKVKQDKHSSGYTRELHYQIQTDTGEPSIFWIFKNVDGKLMIYRRWDGQVRPVEFNK